MSETTTGQKLFVALLASLSLIAWITLWYSGSSPYGGYLHDHAGHSGHQSFGSPFLFLLFIAGWLLMTIAMMLPTTVPLLSIFYRITVKRSDRLLLMVLAIVGYLSAWLIFGLIAWLGIQGLQRATARVDFVQANAWTIGAATLVVAGLFQFSSLKYRCLDKCRSPLSFVAEH